MPRMARPVTIEQRRKRGGVRGTDVVRAKGIDTSSAASAAMVDVDKPLTDKQKAFVHSWAKGNSISRASLDAGFTDDSVGYRLVRMPNVLALKAKFEAKYEASAEMDRKQVMEGFKEAIEMAKLQAEPATMIQGWNSIAKMCGYFAPVETKIKIDVTGSVAMRQLVQMTDAELLEIIEKGAPQALPYVEDVSDES